MDTFEYFEPASINEALALLGQYQGRVKLIAGGTDLLVDMKNGRDSPQYLINLYAMPGLCHIYFDPKEGLRIGAMATIRSLELSEELREKYPAIAQAAMQFTHVAIRNLATLGGNLCHAVASADLAPPLIAYSARARIASSNREREIPLEDFFTGPRQTVLDAGEILLELLMPVPSPHTRSMNVRYSPRATGLPTIVVSVVATVDPQSKICRDIRIVLGNVAPTVIRAMRAEKVIRGKRADESLINNAVQAAHDEARPRSGSLRASAWYKKELVRVFTRQALAEVLA